MEEKILNVTIYTGFIIFVVFGLIFSGFGMHRAWKRIDRIESVASQKAWQSVIAMMGLFLITYGGNLVFDFSKMIVGFITKG